MEKLQERKVVVSIMLVLFCLFLIAWLILIWNENRIVPVDLNVVADASENNGYRWSLEEINVSDRLVVKGWAIKRGESSVPIEMRVVLKKRLTGEGLILPTTVTKRAEITKKMDDGINYDWSGFEVSIPVGEIQGIEKEEYDVILLIQIQDDDERSLDLGATILDKKVISRERR